MGQLFQVASEWSPPAPTTKGLLGQSEVWTWVDTKEPGGQGKVLGPMSLKRTESYWFLLPFPGCGTCLAPPKPIERPGHRHLSQVSTPSTKPGTWSFIYCLPRKYFLPVSHLLAFVCGILHEADILHFYVVKSSGLSFACISLSLHIHIYVCMAPRLKLPIRNHPRRSFL